MQGITIHIDDISADNFEQAALEIFYYQYHENNIYRQFADAVHKTPGVVKAMPDIPFLPVSFFRTHRVVRGNVPVTALAFESSGTTGSIPSRHVVPDPLLYEKALVKGFQKFYGTPEDYAIMALLPSYIERGNSSLVYMAKTLMKQSGHAACGFYLDEFKALYHILSELERAGQPALLIGVTFALLDFAVAYPVHLQHTIVMETGGMKGKKEELTRNQVHDILRRQWGAEQIHSEYGMTELLSQAYSQREGIFECTDTMKVMVRDVNDPLDVKPAGAGALNIIDLANIHSCSFIATDDLGNITADGTFEVLGRLDNSALRGCNLLVV